MDTGKVCFKRNKRQGMWYKFSARRSGTEFRPLPSLGIEGESAGVKQLRENSIFGGTIWLRSRRVIFSIPFQIEQNTIYRLYQDAV